MCHLQFSDQHSHNVQKKEEIHLKTNREKKREIHLLHHHESKPDPHLSWKCSFNRVSWSCVCHVFFMTGTLVSQLLVIIVFRMARPCFEAFLLGLSND